jgi:integrase
VEHDGVTEDSARRAHRHALRACKLDPSYRMHDARHSFAIRWMMENINPELIAHQLGHVDATMVLRVYGKYRPTINDLQRAQEREGGGR